MDQAIRNKLRSVVTQCRKLLEDSVLQELQGKFGVYAPQKDAVQVDDDTRMSHLSAEEQAARKNILDHFEHIKARGFKSKEALDQLVREIAYTHLNRFCAYKMMEARQIYIGDQKFREAVSRGVNSNGVKFYLANHPDDERLYTTGKQNIAYRHFLDWLGGLLSEEIGVLFNPNDSANRLYPIQRVLDEVLALLNDEALAKIWTQDETIGWVYQYFTPKELRDQARKESAAPRNSYELAFRNQFFTPRYVVEFLTDNTLGRIWYEMRKGDTKLKDQCRYMVLRPAEVFLAEGQQPPKEVAEGGDGLLQEELLKQPVHIRHRPKKDPRELKILDPACGSGHFLLYCFDLLLTIYEEAYDDPDLGPALKKDYPTLAELKEAVPGLTLANNLHGIDIDLRCTQIAALALWLRCQRAYQDMGLKNDRPKITKSNLVCAEPMPGEEQMLKEFVARLEPKLLGQLVVVVFDKMKLAGEAGSLLKIEEEIRDAVSDAKRQWLAGPVSIQQALFDDMVPVVRQPQFDFLGVTDDQFFKHAEAKVVDALREFAEQAQNGKVLQRRLFVHDAVQGLAFLALCRQRFDTVLMNSPFGLAQKHLSGLISRCYPDTYVDLYASFVTRGLELAPNGIVGAITSRAFLMTKKLARWRANELIDAMIVMLDLGSPVMDDAFVEACAFTASKQGWPADIVAINRRFASEKSAPLAVSGHDDGKDRWFCITKERLHSLPQSKILYSLPSSIHSLLKSADVFEPAIGTARQGMCTFDDFRFLRLRWEVRPSTIGQDCVWEPRSKGGDFAIYYSDIHLLVKWDRDGREVAEANMQVNGQTAQSRQASDFWRRPGGTYSKRSVKGFSVRALPAGCIIGDIGPAILSNSEIPSEYLVGWLNSRLIVFLVHLQASAWKFNTGVIKQMPWCLPTSHVELSSETKSVIEALRQVAAHDETNSCFVAPPIASSVREAFGLLEAAQKDAITRRDACMARWNVAIDEAYGVDSSQLEALIDEEGDIEGDDAKDEAILSEGLEALAHRVISYAIGVTFGRWDVVAATTGDEWKCLPDPFSELPRSTPGMLKGEDDLPVVSEPSGYPLRIDWDGVLVDDPEHVDDIARRVREVLELIWKDWGEAVENETCEIFGVKALRDYFRKPGKGGFWDDHVSRYSKSRRKAPIYWLLQSAKRNYALWVYYHRLDKDLLFKALVNYVEPKIQRETNRLDEMRREKQAAGESGKTTKKLNNDIERQEDLISELRDFEDKLRRAAKLHLEPDLNDGVVLNIAPLHELVPWKEAKNYWEELLAGKYEWSSIGKQLRQEGIVK